MKPIKSDILAVEILPVEGQTTITAVLTVQRTGAALGSIRWDGKWRQYAFTPAPGARYASRCLHDIDRQLRALMRAWEKDSRRLSNVLDNLALPVVSEKPARARKSSAR